MHFERVFILFGLFWPFLSHVWPYLGHKGPFWDRFGAKIGPFWGDFGPFSAILAYFRAMFTVILLFVWSCFGKLTAKISKMKQEKANLSKILPKITNIVLNCAKTSLFPPIKHLFCLKTSQNRRFDLWKCAVSGCVWKWFGWILSVFMHFYEGLHAFWTGFHSFWPFLTVFEPCLTLFGS